MSTNDDTKNKTAGQGTLPGLNGREAGQADDAAPRRVGVATSRDSIYSCDILNAGAKAGGAEAASDEAVEGTPGPTDAAARPEAFVASECRDAAAGSAAAAPAQAVPSLEAGTEAIVDAAPETVEETVEETVFSVPPAAAPPMPPVDAAPKATVAAPGPQDGQGEKRRESVLSSRAEDKLALLANTAPAASAGAAPSPSLARRPDAAEAGGHEVGGHAPGAEGGAGAASLPHPASEEGRRSLRIVSSLVATAFFMQMLDGTILNTALPSIAKSLGESPLRMQSVVIAYLITVALLIPASGWLADRFGAKKTFFAAIIVFCLGSLLCAMSNSLTGLVAARVLQGVGGAIMVPVGRLVVLRIAPREDFVRVMSFITIPGLVGPLLGPALGGALVQYASWHWIFLINLPVGLLGCVLTLRYMPALIQHRTGHFDWPGFLLFGLSMVAFSLAVEGSGGMHLSRWMWTSLYVAGVFSLLAYCLYALRAKDPLFPLRMFTNRGFAAGIAGNFFARLGGGAMPFLLPLLLQLGLGYSPARAGMALIPMALGGMMIKPFVSPAVKRFGFRTVLVGNTLLQGLAIAGLYFMPSEPSIYLVLGHLTVLGMINSMQFSVMNTVTLLELPPEQASAGNSILAVVTQLSISFGVSVGAVALALFLGGNDVHNAPGWALLPAFRNSFGAIGVWVMLSSIIFSFVPRADRDGKAPVMARPH